MQNWVIILFLFVKLHTFGQEGNGCDVTEETNCIYHENGNKKRCVTDYHSPVNHWHRIQYFDEKGRLISEVETGISPDEYELDYLDSTFNQMYFYNDLDLLIKHVYLNGNDTFVTQYFYTESKRKHKEILYKNGEKLNVTYSMSDLEGNFRARVSEDLQPGIDILLENLRSMQNSGKRIALSSADRIHVVQVSDIIRCESQRNYTLFHITGQKPILVTRTMKEFEDILDKTKFLRVHHSHLINLDYLKEFLKADGGYAVMRDGSQVPVSVRKKDELLRFLGF